MARFPLAWNDEKVQTFLAQWLDTSDTVEVQTSGSTGTPKSMRVPKEAMARSARRTCLALEVGYGDTALLCLPTEYISGKMMVVRAREMGLDLRLGSPGLRPLLGVEEEIDFCAMTPLQVDQSLGQLHQLKKLLIGGGTVGNALLKKIHSQPLLRPEEHRIWETYGMTETLSHIALRRIYPFVESHFTVLPQIRFGQDSEQCLWIEDPATFQGRLQTRDRVELVDGGFRYLGRLDSVINSGGAKIQPEPLEAYYQEQLGQPVLLLGQEDEILGQRLVAVLEGEPNPALAEKLRSLTVALSFHRPKEVYFVPSFVYTETNKPQRQKTLELLGNKA